MLIKDNIYKASGIKCKIYTVDAEIKAPNGYVIVFRVNVEAPNKEIAKIYIKEKIKYKFKFLKEAR